MSELVMAFTTLPVDFDATVLAQDLVGSGLAACVNVLPTMTSVKSNGRFSTCGPTIRSRR